MDLKSQKNKKDWQLSTIQQIERVKKFIENQKYIEWEDTWNNKLIPIDKITDDSELTRRFFAELACPMIANGQFELIINGKTQNTVLKTYSGGEDYSATIYITENKKAFWKCCPCIVD